MERDYVRLEKRKSNKLRWCSRKKTSLTIGLFVWFFADNTIAESFRDFATTVRRDHIAAAKSWPIWKLWAVGHTPKRIQSELQLSIVSAAAASPATEPLFRHDGLRRGNDRFISSRAHRLAQFFFQFSVSQPQNALIIFCYNWMARRKPNARKDCDELSVFRFRLCYLSHERKNSH